MIVYPAITDETMLIFSQPWRFIDLWRQEQSRTRRKCCSKVLLFTFMDRLYLEISSIRSILWEICENCQNSTLVEVILAGVMIYAKAGCIERRNDCQICRRFFFASSQVLRSVTWMWHRSAPAWCVTRGRVASASNRLQNKKREVTDGNGDTVCHASYLY